MATSIPFDPSLVLGNLIHENDIKNLQKIVDAEEPANSAQNQLNNAILTKRKLDMTLQEMVEMNVPPESLLEYKKSIDEIDKQIVSYATDYGQKAITSQKAVASLRGDGGNIKITEMPESPIDWNKSAIKQMPLSSDSLLVDAQYLSNEEEDDNDQSHASKVGVTVGHTVNMIFGPKYAAQASHSAASATLSQTSKHKVVGTLVITATCTHRQSDLFAPFILDPEKAVYAWNATFPSDQIQTTDPQTLVNAIRNADSSGKTDKNKLLSLLSGQTIGSSFVGMVHVLQTESTENSSKTSSSSSALATQMDWGGFFASASGRFGVDASFSDNIKSLLSHTNLTSHCSLVTMGIIPSLKASTVQTAVKQLNPDPREVMKQLSAIQSATDSDVNTMSSEADKAKVGSQFMQLQSNYIEKVVGKLDESDKKSNKIIDTNSLMTAFDSYVTQAKQGNSGVPINFFVRHIDKPMIAKAWLKKFSPLDNWQLSSGDDESKGEGQK